MSDNSYFDNRGEGEYFGKKYDCKHMRTKSVRRNKIPSE